jgi:hypothetical protein
MIRIAAIGDLNCSESKRLDKVLKHALNNADHVVASAAICPQHNILIEKHLKSDRLYLIPSSHDKNFDALGLPRQWHYAFKGIDLVGIDNSEDKFNLHTWALLEAASDVSPLFVFTYKPLLKIDKTTSIMGGLKKCSSRQRLIGWLTDHPDTLLICGHYHDFTFAKTSHGNVLMDGRGELGYTLFNVNNNNWNFNKIII